jgi:hypothetical protein
MYRNKATCQVTWREFMGYRRKDKSPVELITPLPGGDGALLLEQILTMPRAGKQAIGFDDAAAMFVAHYHTYIESKESTRESVTKLGDQWVQWVTDQGYWIVLKGDEYRVIDLH